MMRHLDQIMQRYFSPKKIWGIHINHIKEEHVVIDAILIENKQNTLFILDRKTLSSVEELNQPLFHDNPVCISYDSPNVLIRHVEEDSLELIAEQLHTSNTDDFIIQASMLEEKCQLFIVRRTIFEELAEKLKYCELNILDIVLGPVNIATGMDYVSDDVNEYLKLLNYSIHVREKKLYMIDRKADIDKHGVIDNIGGEFLNETELIPYCNALSILVNGNELPYVSRKVWNAGLTEFSYQQFFKKALPFVLGTILFILLGNFFVLQHYKGKQQKLSLEYAGYQRVYNELVTLQDQFEEHKRMIGQVNLKNDVYFAYYADRIAATIKERVRLTNMDIFPRKEVKVGGKSLAEVEKNIIHIKGMCGSPVELSLWTNDLQEEEFVQSITKQTYQFDEQEQVGRFSFVIKVKSDEVE